MLYSLDLVDDFGMLQCSDGVLTHFYCIYAPKYSQMGIFTSSNGYITVIVDEMDCGPQYCVESVS